jgi:NAD kinase
MIFDMSATLSCRIGRLKDVKPCLNVDGKDYVELTQGDLVRVTKSERRTRLIRLKSLEFYDIIYQKLSVKV